MAVQASKRFILGDYLLEPDKRLLSRAGQPVHLAKRPFQVLLYLIENRDRVVSRHELLDQFWEGKDVYYATLSKCVGAIRKALGDNLENPSYIETRWADGYRYIGPLEEEFIRVQPSIVEVEKTRGVKVVIEEEEIEEAGLETEREQPHQLPGEKILLTRPNTATVAMAAAITLLIAIAATWYLSRTGSTKGSPIRSIAVLPLKNMTEDAAHEYFSDGLTESLISALSKIDQVKVISRGSVFGFKGKEVDPREAGRRLGVAAVLEGSVRKSGDRVRVEVRLVSTQDGRVLWVSDTYDHELGNIFTVQDEIARGVASGLRLKLAEDRSQQLVKRYTNNADAYQSYLKGRYFLNKRSPDDLKRSLEYFQEAIRKDPRYGLAYAGLADCYILSIWFVNTPPTDAIRKAEEAATSAVEIDDTLAEGHIALASVYSHRWDWSNAAREIERALQLDPGNAEARHKYAYSLILMGRADEAIAEVKQALELDPLNVAFNVDMGEILLYARRYDEAIEALRHAIEMDPNRANAHWNLAQAYEQKGMYAEAVEEYIEYIKTAALDGDSPGMVEAHREGYARSGMKGFWQKHLEWAKEKSKRSYYPPYYFARIYARLGEKDQAFYWLEKAYEERSPYLMSLKVDPLLDDLRSDARFADLVRRVGLPQ